MQIKEILEQYNEGIVFKNSIGEFIVSSKLAKYNLLSKKYIDLARDIMYQYASVFEECSSCETFIKIRDSKFREAISIALKEAKNDLISVGIFDVDEASICEYANEKGYFDSYWDADDEFIDKVEQIYGNLEYQKAAREYRKNNRSRWVGGTISSNSNYIDAYMHQAELGVRNAVEGAGHSLVNAVGNMASTANANAQLAKVYNSENTRYKYRYGVVNSVINMHHVVLYFVVNRLNIMEWEIPAVNKVERAEALRNNFSSEVLSEEQRKNILVESFSLNPFAVDLYVIMLRNYIEDAKSISEMADFFGVDLKNEKEQIAFTFVKENVGNTEEQAKKAKKELLKLYEELGVTNFQKCESYKYIQKLLKDYDMEYRTVDNQIFATRKEAELARKEIPDIRVFMKKIIAPTDEATLEYEDNLLKKREEFDTRFKSGLKDKYLAIIDGYLADFDKKYRTVDNEIFETREEADLAKKELPEIMQIMQGLTPPTKDSTLEYEWDLLKIKEDFVEKFKTKLKDKYLVTIDRYLADFDKKFCTISLFKKGTRKEAGKAKALNFVKQQSTDTAEQRETALNNLRGYLPKIGISEEEATEALEYLKKKEHEELYGKESAISKLGKGLGGLFKK